MQHKPFPVIDLVATGQNILRLREERGMSVREMQAYFGFEEPQAIYKWQRGKCLPSVDNLYALGRLLDVPMEDILVCAPPNLNYIHAEQQAEACCSLTVKNTFLTVRWTREQAPPPLPPLPDFAKIPRISGRKICREVIFLPEMGFPSSKITPRTTYTPPRTILQAVL